MIFINMAFASLLNKPNALKIKSFYAPIVFYQ